jgi:hypothetical protein
MTSSESISPSAQISLSDAEVVFADSVLVDTGGGQNVNLSDVILFSESLTTTGASTLADSFIQSESLMVQAVLTTTDTLGASDAPSVLARVSAIEGFTSSELLQQQASLQIADNLFVSDLFTLQILLALNDNFNYIDDWSKFDGSVITLGKLKTVTVAMTQLMASSSNAVTQLNSVTETVTKLITSTEKV